MKVIGITGGVGAGKSTVLDFIRENYNCEIILADDLAKTLCEKGEVCYKPLIKCLSEAVLDQNGNINRGVMASMIFNNSELLDAVNNIIHPAVRNYILDRINVCREADKPDFLFIEAALLIETGYKEIVDELWYIYTEVSVRRERLKKSRGYSDEKIDSILNSQLSDEEFRKNSDFVIDNSETPEESHRAICERMSTYGYGK